MTQNEQLEASIRKLVPDTIENIEGLFRQARDVTLADVLRATSHDIDITLFGSESITMHHYDDKNYHRHAKWNLSILSLSGQSQECKNFLYQIICK